MTVMDAEHTGEMEIIVPPTPEVDRIVTSLAGPVWTLLRAGKLDAAIILMSARVDEFDEAWRKEYVGVTKPPAEPVREVNGCTSMHHTGLDCPTALREGKLAEGVAFCAHCSLEQVRAPYAPTQPTDTGSIVHIVTTAGASKVRTSDRKGQARAS